MANIKLSDLSDATVLDGNDFLAGVNAGTTRKFRLYRLRDYFSTPETNSNLVTKFADEITGYTDEWAWIKAREAAGDYAGIHVGDFIPVPINGTHRNVIIMGIDTYKRYGQPHHIDWRFDHTVTRAMQPYQHNNGLIPIEEVITNGSTKVYTLTKPMASISSITQGGTELTGWTYDVTTHRITFAAAPSAGTIVVTGVGYKNPWQSTDMYLFLNALAGNVPNQHFTFNPSIVYKDYTETGFYNSLPQKLKNAIVNKTITIANRYSETEYIKASNGNAIVDLGKIWPLSEVEIYGFGVYASKPDDLCGCVQYPFFANTKRPLSVSSSIGQAEWLLNAVDNSSYSFCCVRASDGMAYARGADYQYNFIKPCFRT